MARFVHPTRLAYALAAAFSMAVPAHAQTPPGAAAAAQQADVLQRQDQERVKRDIEAARPRDRSAPAIDPLSLMPKVDASAAGKKCHAIKQVSIAGATQLAPAVRDSLGMQFSNRCLGVAEIEQLLGELTREYITRGFITTRVYLPPQDLSRGTLNITVLEGVLESIVLDDGAQRSINPRNVFPSPGGLLNLRDFEQGIDQVNKLASNSAQLDIQPGAAAGGSRVLIRNDPRRPIHAGISADNQGSEATGKEQVGVNLAADRLLGWNELLLYTDRRSQPNDPERQASVSRSLTMIVPFGYSTVSYSGSRARFVSTVALPSGQDIQFRGLSGSDSFKLERLMYRDQRSRGSLAATLTVKDSENYLAGQLLDVSSRTLSVLDLDASASTAVLGGAVTLDLGYAHGLKVAGALRDEDGLPDDSPRAQFGKVKLGLNYSRPFKVGSLDAGWSTQLTAQYARNSLFGSEQILIGGLYSVRGYVENTLSGDHGWHVRNELSLRPVLDVAGQVVPLRVYAGLDAGRVSSRNPELPRGHLAGVALGVSANWKGVGVDISATRAIGHSDLFTREATQAWVRLNFDL